MLLLLTLFGLAAGSSTRPVIGVLAVPIGHADCVTLAGRARAAATREPTACFDNLYVKWIEAAGGRVAPIRYDLPPDELDQLLQSLNGALITGGGEVLEFTNPYVLAAKRMYDHALSMHAKGSVWPLWGTCMGFQLLAVLGADDSSVLVRDVYDSEGLMLALQLTPAAATSRLLCERCLYGDALSTLSKVNSTVNLHHDGVPSASFAPGTKLGGSFSVLSSNTDRKGREFASTIEATGGAPIWGVQWHPERPQFEWRAPPRDFMSHTTDTTNAMFSVASRFLSFARRNDFRFESDDAEAAALIYNYRPVGNTSYEAYYF